MTGTDAFQEWMEIFEGWGDGENETVQMRQDDQGASQVVQRLSTEAQEEGERPRDVCGVEDTAVAINRVEQKDEDYEMKIEKDIPVPPRGNKPHPWEDMEIGDSFFVEASPEASMRQIQNTMFTSLRHRRKDLPEGYGISTRRWPRGKPYGIRVWRVK